MRKEVIELDVKADGAINEVQGLQREVDKLGNSVADVNKETKKTSEGFEEVTKNGGAIAILDQLTGGLATRVRDAYEATKLFNFSLKGTKTALIATGVGAFVVALGVVVAYWDEIVDFITGANKQLEIQNGLIKENQTTLDNEFKILEAKEKLLIAEGKSVEGVREEKEKLIKLQLIENENLLKNLKAQLQKEKSVAKELSFFEKLQIKAKGILSPQAEINAIAALTLERDKTLGEIENQISSAEERALTLQTLLANLNKPDEEKETPRTKTGTRKAVVGVEAYRPEDDPELTIEQLRADAKVAINNASTDLITVYNRQNRQDEAEEKKKADQEELLRLKILQQQKIGIISQTFGAIAGILGENSKIGKAAAIAQATINTYQGITEVWSTKSILPEPFATISRIANTATVLASGLSAVRAIQSQQLPNIAGGGGNLATSAPPQAASPQFNIVGQSGVNQLAQSIGQQQSQPVKAYVVSKDVTTQQELDRNTISIATFG